MSNDKNTETIKKEYIGNEPSKKITQNAIIFILIVLLIVAFIISFTLGRYPISFNQLINAFYLKITQNGASNNTVQAVLFDVRLPRIIAAILVGSVLSVSGAAFQGLFKNPMVSSDILGASAGAGFGAAIAILLSLGSIWIQLLSFSFGLAAVALTYFISKAVGRGSSPILVLILTGMVVQALFTSFISLTKYVADPDSKLPAITFWLMGGLSSITMNDIKIILIPMLLGLIPLMLVRWKLNVLSFGDEEAQSMGIDTNKVRTITIICATLLTASTVSICGMIGWVGLVIPHLARMIVGPNYKVLLPASLLVGGIFMLGVDDVARCMFAMEIPLGILTAMIGAPVFIYLLLKGKRGWM
ncbi:FecCD family ABC transporter permease [Clostridium psychrophilum]|uniref:FecCD family ABC transporter permease n=1 Tax=Clostridium psychrophilum TaxID=132926 RepID=UPI001C0B107C|nr:iron ABC transporter permease [Clostridium psychrophilum]